MLRLVRAFISITFDKNKYFLLLKAYCTWGIQGSLPPSFYPSEAAKRGAKPSQYGFVFGITNLAAFVFAPIFARIGLIIGPRMVLNVGALLEATSGVAMGMLGYLQTAGPFIGLSYLMR